MTTTPICPSTIWTSATRQSRRRRKAAPRVPLARPLARPAPAPDLGPGPGKRVQVKGNARQNVSISLTSLFTPVR